MSTHHIEEWNWTILIIALHLIRISLIFTNEKDRLQQIFNQGS